MDKPIRVLLVDDQLKETPLCGELRERNIVLELLPDCKSAIRSANGFDAILLDLQFPEGEMQGKDALEEFQKRDPLLPVLILTVRGDLAARKGLLQRGAAGYLYKWEDGPDADEIAIAVERAVRSVSWRRYERSRGPAPGLLTGPAPRTCELRREFKNILPDMRPVLLIGAPGTGKTLLAAELHRQSRRRGNDLFFFDAALGELPDLEKRGAFDFARYGTVVVENLEALAPRAVNKLKRAIPEETRLIATARRQPDMHFQCFQSFKCVFLPALADRRADIPDLVDFFVKRYDVRSSVPHQFAPEAIRLLQDRDYPGNLGQLKDTVEDAASAARNSLIRPEDLPEPTGTNWDLEQAIPSVLEGRLTWWEIANRYRKSIQKQCEARIDSLEVEMKRRFFEMNGKKMKQKEIMGCHAGASSAKKYRKRNKAAV